MIILIIALLALGSLLPIEGNYKLKIVNAGSMEPTIAKGSLIVIKPKELYKKGDIITFVSGGGKDGADIFTTHKVVDSRVIEGKYSYMTKGDANVFPDAEFVPSEKIAGRVILKVPFVEDLAGFVKTPGGFFILVLIPALAILGETWFRKNKKTLT